MTYLDAINTIIGTCGYVPLASLDEEHSFKDAAVSLFDRVLHNALARGWYFNRRYQTLQPDAQGNLYVTHDCIDFRPTEPGFYKAGNRIVEIGDTTLPVGRSLRGRLVYELPYEDCPTLFKAWALADAKVQFQTVYDGDSTKTRQLTADLQVAWSAFHTSEIQGTAANLLDSNPRVQELRDSYGYRTHRMSTYK